MRKFFIYGILPGDKKIYVTVGGLIVPLFEQAAKFDTEEQAQELLKRFEYELGVFNAWRIDSTVSNVNNQIKSS